MADTARGRHERHVSARTSRALDVDRWEHRYVNIRLLGWSLIGLWQVLSLASEFVPLDLESRFMRVLGKILGLAGLLLVAWGFERLFALKHPGHRFQLLSRGNREP